MKRTTQWLIYLAILLAASVAQGYELAGVSIGTTASLPAPTNTIVELPMDEGTGTTAGDVSGNGNDGTLTGGALFEASSGDGSAYSVRFDAVDDYIDLGTVDVAGTGLTLSAWFNADTFPGASKDPRIIAKSTSTASNDHIFMLGMIDVSGVVRVRGRVRVGGITETLISSIGVLSTGQWTHVAMTYDGATMLLYLDGIEVSSTPLEGTVDTDATMAVAIGAQPPGAGGRFFDGLIDAVHIYERGLSAAEVHTLADAPNRAPSASPDSYQTPVDTQLLVNEGSGVLANDTDPDDDVLTAILVADVSNGTLSLASDGSFQYDPTTSFDGQDGFTYKANDGFLDSNTASVTLTVGDPPTVSYPNSPSEVGITAAACPNWEAIKTTSPSFTVTENGALIENYDVSGRINVNAANVTIRCTRVVTSSDYAIDCKTFGGNTCGGGLTIENSEIENNGNRTGGGVSVISFAGNLTITDSYVWGGSDTLKVHGDGNLISHNWIGCQRGLPGAHMDTMQSSTMTNSTFSNNYLVGLGCPDSQHHANDHNSANLFFQSDGGVVDTILIEGNYLHGGGKVIQFDADSEDESATNNLTTRNNTATAAFWRYNSILGRFKPPPDGVPDCSAWTGNTFSDESVWTSAVMDQDASCPLPP